MLEEYLRPFIDARQKNRVQMLLKLQLSEKLIYRKGAMTVGIKDTLAHEVKKM